MDSNFSKPSYSKSNYSQSSYSKSSQFQSRKEKEEIKLPPCDIQAERLFLASILYDANKLNDVIELVEPHYFFQPEHRFLYEAILSLYDKNEPIDVVTVYQELIKQGTDKALEAFCPQGISTFIGELSSLLPTSSFASHYAKIIKEKYLLREIIRNCNLYTALAYSQTEEAVQILNRADKDFFDLISLEQSKQSKPFYTAQEIALSVYNNLETLVYHPEAMVGIPTGYKELDNHTGGFHRGDLILIAARPGMGKTAFALNLAYNMANPNITKAPKEYASLFISLETSRDQLMLRLFSKASQIPFQKLRTKQYTPEDLKKLDKVLTEIKWQQIFIDDTPARTITEIRSVIRRANKKQPIDIVFIDYLQLIRPNKQYESRQQQIAEISNALKNIAKEFNIPVVALSQLNRKVEDRQDKRPQLSDLRESGTLEQDADLILFLYRDEVYNQNTDKKGQATIIIGKQRNGPSGIDVNLTFKAHTVSFENPEENMPLI